MMTRHALRPIHVAMFLSAAVCAAAGGQGPEFTGDADKPAFAPPKYQLLRYREDWSGLADVPESGHADFWDAIKNVKLSEDGEIRASFGGSLQLRFESWWHFGFLPSAAGDDTLLQGRLLLHADVHFGENFRAFVEGKSALSTDRSLPGGTRTADVDTLALQQAFVDLRVPLDDDRASLVIRPGRQMYLFGKQRLVSPLAWSNTMRTWDGVTAILAWDNWRVEGFGSHFVPVRKYEYNRRSQDIVFFGAYATGTFDKAGLSTDLYFLGLNKKLTQTFNGSSGSEDRYTFGARVSGTVPETSFDYDVEAAYQFGRVGSADVSAWMLGSQFGYTFAGAWSAPRVFGGVEFGSGDGSSGGNVQTFNQLFPLGHAYLGYIDLVGRQNVIAPNLGVKFTPFEKLTIALNGLYFWRASTNDALYNAGGGVVRSGSGPLAPGQTGLSSSRDVGGELDLTFACRFDRHTKVELGYSHFFPGDFIRETGPSNDVDFLYLQVQYTF